MSYQDPYCRSTMMPGCNYSCSPSTGMMSMSSMTPMMFMPSMLPTMMSMPTASSVTPTIASMATGCTGLKCDLLEKDTCYHIMLDIPGISKNDIDVSLENGTITVCGNKLPCCDFDASKDSYHYKERSTGRFTRMFKLPPNADFSKSSATHVNGVLVLTFPKMTGTLPSQQKLLIR